MYHAANDELSPFQAWWIGQGGSPDLRADSVATTVAYLPAAPTGNQGTWPALPGLVAPSVIRVVFNDDPLHLALGAPHLDALADWAVLFFHQETHAAEFPFRPLHVPLPAPQTRRWSAEDLDAVWARWAHEQTDRVARFQAEFPHLTGRPRTAAEQLHHLAEAAWERFSSLPIVQAHPCSEATYWDLIHSTRPGDARVEDRYAARFRPGPGQVLPFRPRRR